MADLSDDNFRPEFKRYKRKSPPPCLKDVLDTDDDGHERVLYRLELSQLAQGQNYLKSTSDATRFGLQNPNAWKCYGAHGYPGFQFIRNPFSPGAQRYWVKRFMADYPCKPNVTNLDTQYPGDQLANPWQASRKKLSSPSQTLKEKTLMDQLRWVTLGYHYDWNNKVYIEDHHSPFPEDLGLMSALIAGVLGYPIFQPQASIVNFYHMDSTLGGHTDHSEFDLTAPLISYSLGQSAILLVGGKTKATKPLALHLRSGDVVILGGESRLAYHAVPKIMYAHDEGQIPQCFGSSEDQQMCKESKEGVDGSSLSSMEGGDHLAMTHEQGQLPQCLGPSEDQQRSEARKEGADGSSLSSMEGGDHPAMAFRGSQGSMKVRCETSTDSIFDCNSGPSRKCIVDSDAALANDPTPDVHSEQCPDHPNPEQPNNMQDSRTNSTYLGDTVSRTTLSISEGTQHGELDRVSGNISSAMKDLSREDQWREFEQYLKHARINISVRQVTGPGRGFPRTEGCYEEGDRVTLPNSNTKRTKVDES